MPFVADLERSVRFYTDVFAMDAVACEPRLRCPISGDHHDFGLFGVGTAGGPKARDAIGLYHLAWQRDTIDELAGTPTLLCGSGSPIAGKVYPTTDCGDMPCPPTGCGPFDRSA